MATKLPMTEWGARVTAFRARYGITHKELCEQLGIGASTLAAVLVGKTPGRNTIAIVDQYITDVEAEQRPPQTYPFANQS